jgi:hypothetical protein
MLASLQHFWLMARGFDRDGAGGLLFCRGAPCEQIPEIVLGDDHYLTALLDFV